MATSLRRRSRGIEADGPFVGTGRVMGQEHAHTMNKFILGLLT